MRSQDFTSEIKSQTVSKGLIYGLLFLSAGDGQAFLVFSRSVSYAGSNQVRFDGLAERSLSSENTAPQQITLILETNYAERNNLSLLRH